MPRTSRTLVALATVATLAVSGCGLAHDSSAAPRSSSGASGSGGSSEAAEQVSTASATAAATGVNRVVVVSIDGLNPQAIRRLGKERAPTLHRLIARGASTLNARTERELTNTLPNHTGMVTGRRVIAKYGGHGITWNDDAARRPTVHGAAGHRVSSVFTAIHQADEKSAVFAGKEKFELFERSWSTSIDRFVQLSDNGTLVDKVNYDIKHRNRALRFVHLSGPDGAGHAHGFMGDRYLDAVAATDRRLGTIVNSLKANATRAARTVLIVTADHGGNGESHRDQTKLDNYRIPFIVWGAGVAKGKSLYKLNPDYANPGKARTNYRGKQPVRNGDVANLVTDLLGLKPVKGSEHDATHDLDVR